MVSIARPRGRVYTNAGYTMNHGIWIVHNSVMAWVGLSVHSVRNITPRATATVSPWKAVKHAVRVHVQAAAHSTNACEIKEDVYGHLEFRNGYPHSFSYCMHFRFFELTVVDDDNLSEQTKKLRIEIPTAPVGYPYQILTSNWQMYIYIFPHMLLGNSVSLFHFNCAASHLHCLAHTLYLVSPLPIRGCYSIWLCLPGGSSACRAPVWAPAFIWWWLCDSGIIARRACSKYKIKKKNRENRRWCDTDAHTPSHHNPLRHFKSTKATRLL